MGRVRVQRRFIMKAKILVVDDDEGIREIVKTFLETAGYEVTEAADAATTRKAFAGPAPDVVLLDLKLPDGYGLELLPELKKSWPKSKIIILTGDHSVETGEAAYKMDGQVFLLNKPFDVGVLEALVEMALAQK